MTNKHSLTAIVAATSKNGIGLNGTLPWRLPNEMKYFARVTSGETASTSATSSTDSDGQRNAVIMGRKTWESIPPRFRPLKDRRNLIISRQGVQLSGEALTTSHSSLEDAVSVLDTSTKRAFLIGGAQLYNATLQASPPTVERVLLTRVLTDFDCDTFLHDFTRQTEVWKQASHEQLCEWVGWQVPAGEQEEKGVKYQYEMWVRV